MKTDNRNTYVASAEFILEEELCDQIVFTQFSKLCENLHQWIYEDHSPSLEIRLRNFLNNNLLSENIICSNAFLLNH